MHFVITLGLEFVVEHWSGLARPGIPSAVHTFEAIALCFFQERFLLAVVGNVSREIHDFTARVDVMLLMMCCQDPMLIFVSRIATLPMDVALDKDCRIFAKLLLLP